MGKPFYIVAHDDGTFSLCLPFTFFDGEYADYGQEAFNLYAAERGDPIMEQGLYTHGSGYEWETAFRQAFAGDPNIGRVLFDCEAGGFFCGCDDLSIMEDFGRRFKEICEDTKELQPAEGFLPNEESYPVEVTEDGQVIEITVINDRIPEIGTTATIEGEKEVYATEVFTLEDVVEYQHLIPGVEYTLEGVLMDKTTGEPLLVNGEEVRSALTFIPEEPSGSVTVSFTFDARYIKANTDIVDTLPEIPGLAVWHEGHIGIYIGNGQVIHASSTMVGVIQTPIGSSGWTHWLKIPYITYLDSDVPSAVDESRIWDTLYAKIGNPYGVAGLMGNLFAESGLLPNNLQDSYEGILGFTDATYTQAVDNGSYSGFTSDSAGYGLAQWTVQDRKTELRAFANERGCSISDLDMQLAFLYGELETKFPDVLAVLRNATSVREASDYVLLHFEAPLNQGEAVQAQRAGYGSIYYARYGQ